MKRATPVRQNGTKNDSRETNGMTTNDLTMDDQTDKDLAELRPLVYPVFHTGQRLDEVLLNAHADADRRWGAYFGRLLAGVGILDGLQLVANSDHGANAVLVKSGAAIDSLGRLIILPNDYTISLDAIELACSEHGEELGVWLEFCEEKDYAKSEEKSKKNGPLYRVTHSFRVSLAKHWGATEELCEAPQKTPTSQIATISNRCPDSKADICLGTIARSAGGEKSYKIEANEVGRSTTIPSIEQISQYLSRKPTGSHIFLSDKSFHCSVGEQTPFAVFSLRDDRDQPIADESVTFTVATNGLLTKPEHSAEWSETPFELRTKTDENGKLKLQFLGRSPGAFVAIVQVRFDSPQIATPSAVTIPIRIDHILQANPETVSGFCGEEKVLQAYLQAELPDRCSVFFVDEIDDRIRVKAQSHPDSPRCFTAPWKVRRIGSHTVRVVLFFDDEMGSDVKQTVQDSIPITVCGEMTRVVVQSGNHQRCNIAEELRYPIIVRVERMDGEPVSGARVEVTGRFFDFDMSEGIPHLDHDAGENGERKRYGKTDKNGCISFSWAPCFEGLQVLAVKHVATSIDQDRRELSMISVADALVFAHAGRDNFNK